MALEDFLRYDLAGSGILVGEVVLALIILVTGVLCVRWVAVLFARRLRAMGVADLTEVFLVRTFRALLYVAIIGLSLTPLGVDLMALVIGFAVIGIIVGLALQDVLSNVVGGILLSIYRPFRRGDTITAAEVTGKVETLGVAATVLRTTDNQRVTIPNRIVWDEAIVTKTAYEIRQLELPVHLAYDQELPRALEVLVDAARGHPKVLEAPPPGIVVKALGPRAIEVGLQAWCETEDFPPLQDTLLVRVKEACDAEGVVLYQAPAEAFGPRY